MDQQHSQNELSALQGVGILIFVFACGIPALELNGFGFGIDFSLETALLIAIIGGALGGLLICFRPWLAGVVGGLIAGPLGLYAVYFWTQNRAQVWNVELVLVQGIGCLPGIGVGLLLARLLSPKQEPGYEEMDEFEQEPYHEDSYRDPNRPLH